MEMSWITTTCGLFLNFFYVVFGFDVDASRYAVIVDTYLSYSAANQYCVDNGLGQLAAITHTRKQRLVSAGMSGQSGEFWLNGYILTTHTYDGNPWTPNLFTQEAPNESYKCAFFSDWWENHPDRFNLGGKPCHENKKFVCELHIPLASRWMVQTSAQRLMNHVTKSLSALKSHMLCARACVVTISCRSYNYQAGSGMCELNDSGLEVVSDVTAEEGWEWSWY